MAYRAPKIDQIFNDLEEYLDFCRFELREYNPAHLYDKSNENYRAFLASKRPRGYQGKNFRPGYNKQFKKAY